MCLVWVVLGFMTKTRKNYQLDPVFAHRFALRTKSFSEILLKQTLQFLVYPACKLSICIHYVSVLFMGGTGIVCL